jgi:DNA-binding MarR family transcriptional regulator
MTELVRRLEESGLVERRPDPADGRASLIFLTARSRDFEPAAGVILDDLDRLVRGQIGEVRTAELRASLTELLDLGRSA